MTGQLHPTTALHSGAAPGSRRLAGCLGSQCRSVPAREETNRLSLSGMDLPFAHSVA